LSIITKVKRATFFATVNINKIVIKILQGSKVTVLGELTVANIFQLQIYYMEKMCQKLQKLVAVDKLIAIRFTAYSKHKIQGLSRT